MSETKELNINIRRRLGLLKIAQDIVDAVIEGRHESVCAFRSIFNEFVVVKAEANYASNTIYYTGYHPEFEILGANCAPLGDNNHPPLYKAIISRHQAPNGLVTFTCKFVKI